MEYQVVLVHQVGGIQVVEEEDHQVVQEEDRQVVEEEGHQVVATAHRLPNGLIQMRPVADPTSYVNRRVLVRWSRAMARQAAAWREEDRRREETRRRKEEEETKKVTKKW